MPKSAFTGKYRRFCRMLAEARAAAGMTQTELADKIGWQQTNVSKVERGERRLDVVEFLQFAEALGVDAAEFVRRLSRERR